MRAKDIKIGEDYQHKNHIGFGWATPLKMLKPKEGENTNSYRVIKCAWTVDKGGSYGLIKYFRPSDLVRPASKPSTNRIASPAISGTIAAR